jgi:signal transduction histidine kinase
VRVAKNLMGNAQRYAKSTLRIRAYDTPHPSDPSKTRTCVEFDDDGPGIPESKWLEVLEPFVRLSETGQSRSLPGQLDRSSNQSTPINYAGIGLGLAIVNRILKQHNGSLEIAKSPLGGCSVRTFWPCPKDRTA